MVVKGIGEVKGGGNGVSRQPIANYIKTNYIINNLVDYLMHVYVKVCIVCKKNNIERKAEVNSIFTNYYQKRGFWLFTNFTYLEFL